jgi:hypothetical protein
MVRPASDVGTKPSEAGPLSFDDLFAASMRGKPLEITVRNGSIFKGTLVSVGPDVVRLEVDGMDVPISRKTITRIVLVSK